GAAATMVLVHQLQVGGLVAPGLLAPDPTRLAAGLGTGDLAGKAGRGAWALVKGSAVAAVVAWMLYRHASDLEKLAARASRELAAASAVIVLDLARTLAVAALALGAVDYLLSWRRVDALLRQTPDEYREDLKALDGDPALRARRRALALSWRRDAAA